MGDKVCVRLFYLLWNVCLCCNVYVQVNKYFGTLDSVPKSLIANRFKSIKRDDDVRLSVADAPAAVPAVAVASAAAMRKMLKRRLLRITLIASNLCQMAKRHAIHMRLPLK